VAAVTAAEAVVATITQLTMAAEAAATVMATAVEIIMAGTTIRPTMAVARTLETAEAEASAAG
jgi:hypothetical protein